jgi:hypothetical protein
MNPRQLQTNLLLQAGRLLLEYNESTAAIHLALMSTAKALTGEACQVAVSYGSVAVAMAGEGAALESVSELRYNTAVQARVHEILAQVRRGQLDTAAALTCTPDGQTLVSGGRSDRLKFLKVDTEEELPPLENQFGDTRALAFAPDGELAVASLNTIKLWDVANREERFTFPVPDPHHTIVSLAFAPDGKVLAAAGDDGTVRLWHAATD